MLKKSDLAVLVFFAVVYAASLTFEYVEGDDATTIAYHAAGRDLSLFSPYSVYHCGFDLLLGIFPANEFILRFTAVAVSAISELVFAILLMRLVFGWLSIDGDSRHAMFVSLAVLLCVPELFFLGLYANPSAVAVMFVLGAHLLLRSRLEKDAQPPWRIMVLSSVLFGLGVSFRWNVALYGTVIAADMLLVLGRPWAKHFGYVVGYGVLCLIGASLWLSVAGATIADVRGVLSLSQSVVTSHQGESRALKYLGACSLFTPTMLVFSLMGTVLCIKQEKGRLLLLIVGLLPVVAFKSIHPKMIITAYPVLVLVLATGLDWLLRSVCTRRRHRAFLLAGVICILCSPWLFGIKITTTVTQYGPGFERNNVSQRDADQHIRRDVRLSSAIESVGLGLFDGFMIPTSEGPRPLGGYAGILLGGKWREFVLNENREFRAVVEHSRRHAIPIIIVRGDPKIETTLLREEYYPLDEEYHRIHPDIIKRSFRHRENEDIVIYKIQRFEGDEDAEIERKIIRHCCLRQFIVFSTYTSIIAELKRKHPRKVSGLGARSILFSYSQ